MFRFIKCRDPALLINYSKLFNTSKNSQKDFSRVKNVLARFSALLDESCEVYCRKLKKMMIFFLDNYVVNKFYKCRNGVKISRKSLVTKH